MDRMIEALLRPEAYNHPTEDLRLLETHLSWVLLSGAYAYKLKKPVNLGFVDFSTPELRRQACQEELRLNHRLAPDLYLDLCPVHGPAEQASFHGTGPEIAVAVRMRRFAQRNLLPAVLGRGELEPQVLDQLADVLASFHAAAAIAAPDAPWGSPDQVRSPALANLAVLAPSTTAAALLEPLQQWTLQEGERLEGHFRQRRARGRIREGHGDLHLGNMALHQGQVVVFDCLEFSPALRWIDLTSDLAFLVMDLQARRQPLLAARLLNRWLVALGDYEGLRAWRWYSVYRALVRAKVATLRAGQDALSADARTTLVTEQQQYLQLAGQISRDRPAGLLITHGLSGSGKSMLATTLAERLGWLHLRSDVERRRWFGRWGHSLEPLRHGDAYTAAVGVELLEQHLPACAAAALAGGWSVLVDATFLRQRERQQLAAVAQAAGVPFLILACPCDPEQAAERIRRRLATGEDPSEAPPELPARQVQWLEPLTASERQNSLALDGSLPPHQAVEAVLAEVQQRLRL